MMTELPTDPHDRQQLEMQLARIRNECPAFMAWLAASVEATTRQVCGMSGDLLYRATGALADLRTISATISDPPKAEKVAPPPAQGTGYA